MFITVSEEAIFYLTHIVGLKKNIKFTEYFFKIIYKQKNNQQRKKQNQNWKIQFLLI